MFIITLSLSRGFDYPVDNLRALYVRAKPHNIAYGPPRIAYVLGTFVGIRVPGYNIKGTVSITPAILNTELDLRNECTCDVTAFVIYPALEESRTKPALCVEKVVFVIRLVGVTPYTRNYLEDCIYLRA
eukprot:1180047-Prorocentrum_minimum.AAC.1